MFCSERAGSRTNNQRTPDHLPGEGFRPRFSSRRFARSAEGVPANRKLDQGCSHRREVASGAQRSRGDVSAGREPCAWASVARQSEVYTQGIDRLLRRTGLGQSVASLQTYHDRSDLREQQLGGARQVVQYSARNQRQHPRRRIPTKLAHASVQKGNLTQARICIRCWPPPSPRTRCTCRNYEQVVERMESEGAPPVNGITAEGDGGHRPRSWKRPRGLSIRSYPDAVAVAVRVGGRPVSLLQFAGQSDTCRCWALLPQAPRNMHLNQRLGPLHTRFQRLARRRLLPHPGKRITRCRLP